jgi:alanine-glyoxylate transaminase/(R)-3-amino-2-methylpropionate-pyruvate transaminase
MPQFDYEPPQYTGPSLEEMKAKRSQYVSPANFMFYRNPIMIVDGNMQYLYDQDGKRYLDCFAGISTVGVGHCHPRVTSKVKE